MMSENKFKTPSQETPSLSREKQEERFYALMDQQDDQTRKTLGFRRIVDQAEDSGDFDTAFQQLVQLIAKRNAAIDRVSVSLPEKNQILDREGIEQILGQIRIAISSPERFIGNGATCDVFTLRHSIQDIEHNTCIKVVRDYQMYRENHSLRREMDILDKLQDLKVDGVRSPRPLFAFSSIRFEGMAMDHLNAVNFRRVIEEQTTEGVKDELPSTFDQSVYFQRLRNYVKEMHANGVVHNDLHLRNMMVDTVTGLPYVIDFGKAMLETDLDKTRFSMEDIKKYDYATIDAAEAEVRQWLRART